MCEDIMVIFEENVGQDVVELRKGRGFVYAHAKQLYNRVKNVGNVKYLKCCRIGCDGSAKIPDGKLFIGVRNYTN